ncbi:MAG: hypothetical protein NTY22_01585 [Proteobacteria bacterium]|nr:hypothetical protein [Pseudomonadota bacterium]
MKRIYYNLINGKTITAFIFCYIVLFLVGALNKFLLFSFGRGDTFFTVFKFINTELGLSNTVFNSLMSYLMFLGSFYGALLWPFFYLVMMTFFAAVIQFILHIFLKNPKRFSITLSIFYTVIAFLYILTVIPFVGHLAFSILFIFMTGKEIAAKNSFSTGRGVLLMITPGIVVSILSFGFIFSIFKMISFF